MSKKTDALRAAASRVTDTRTEDKPAKPAKAAETTSTGRATPARAVRTTLDLQPVEHRRFTRWCNEAAEDLGVSEVKKAAVLRALLDELQENAELSTRIRRRVADTA